MRPPSQRLVSPRFRPYALSLRTGLEDSPGRAAPAAASPSPAWLAAKPVRQPLVIRREVLVERCSQRRRHWGPRASVVAVERRITTMRQPEKFEHRVIDRLGSGEEVATVRDVYALVAEQPRQSGELLAVLAALAVGVVLMAQARVARVSDNAFGLSVESLVLELERAFEWLGLEPPRRLVGVRRKRALDWVADKDEQLHTGQVVCDPLGCKGVKHVVRA